MRPIFLLLLVPLLCGFAFSEVMYDPPGNDNNQEYVEIAVNLSADALANVTFIFGDAESNDTAEPLWIPNASFFPFILLVEEGYAYTNYSCPVFSLGATIGNNLGNEGDQLLLWIVDNGTRQVANSSYVANDSCVNCSLSNYNGSWKATPPSPCYPNPALVIPALNTTNTSWTNSTINSTINTTTDPPIPPGSCLYNFSIWVENERVDSGEKLFFRPLLDTEEPFSITYWFEDLHGLVKKKRVTTTNTNKKSFTPKTDERDMVLILIMELELPCAQDRLERIVVVKGDEEAEPADEERSTASATPASHQTTDVFVQDREPLVVDAPPQALINQTLFVNLSLYNEGYASELFLTWAYLFRGSKSYSGDRDANMQEVVVQPLATENLTLPIVPDISEPGEYKLKVKAIKGGRKTPYEETLALMFLEPPVIPVNTTKNGSTATLSPPAHTSPSNPTIVEDEKDDRMVGAAVVELPREKGSWILDNGAWLAVVIAALLWLVRYIIAKNGAPSSAGHGMHQPDRAVASGSVSDSGVQRDTDALRPCPEASGDQDET